MDKENGEDLVGFSVQQPGAMPDSEKNAWNKEPGALGEFPFTGVIPFHKMSRNRRNFLRFPSNHENNPLF
jgi:hypothetical protein